MTSNKGKRTSNKGKGLRVIQGGKEVVIRTKGRSTPPKPDTRSAKDPRTGLTAKQEKFANGVAQGLRYAEAYRNAYDAENMKDATVWRSASDTAALPHVRARIEALLEEREREALHDGAKMRERILTGLQREAESGDTSAARIRALELLGKACHVGLFVEQIQQETVNRTPEEVEAALRDKLQRLKILDGSRG